MRHFAVSLIRIFQTCGAEMDHKQALIIYCLPHSAHVPEKNGQYNFRRAYTHTLF